MTDVIDTSVAVPLLLRSHDHHLAVSSALTRPTCLSAQSLAETYAVITRLPGDARLSMRDAARLLDVSFEPPVAPTGRTLALLPRLLADAGIAGGATYDALVALAAKEAERTLLTRDVRATTTYRAIGVRFEVLAHG